MRIKKNFSKAEPLKDSINQHVDLGNNHHVLIYKNENGELKEDVVTFWTAVERKRQKLPVVQLPEADRSGEIVTTLQINDMFLLGLDDDKIDWSNLNYHEVTKCLYRVQKFTSKDYYFRKHQESNLEGELGKAFQYIKGFGQGKTGWKSFNPIKVKVTPTGKIMKI